MKIVLPKLPYELDALAPTISRRQLEVHYRGHLKGYVDKLNQLPVFANLEKMKLEEVIVMGKHQHVDNRVGVLPPGEHPSTLYNLSAQVYNHTFYFNGLRPGSGPPSGDIAEIIDAQYGSWEAFRKKLIAKGNNLFGSGWIWVVLDDEGELSIIKGLDAEVPFVYRGLTPIFCIDVWEHAYYLDYENHRGDYLRSVIDNLINWSFVNKNLRNTE